MAIVDMRGTVRLQELIISSLAQSDAVAKLMIEEAEFMKKLSAERAGYQGMLGKTR